MCLHVKPPKGRELREWSGCPRRLNELGLFLLTAAVISNTSTGAGGTGFSMGFGASSSYSYKSSAVDVKTKGSCGGSELKDAPAKTSGSSCVTKKASRWRADEGWLMSRKLQASPISPCPYLLFWVPFRCTSPKAITSVFFLTDSRWIFTYSLGCINLSASFLFVFSENFSTL